MKKEYINNIILFTLNVIVVALIASENLFSKTIQVGNSYITYTMVVCAILFIVLMILRTNMKVTLITNISRMSFERILALFSYIFFNVSFIAVFIYVQQIDILVGIFLLMLEIIFIMSLLFTSINNIVINFKYEYVKFKEFIFFTLVLDLILKNMPFEVYSIPVSDMLIAAYLILVSYIVFKLLSYLKSNT